MANNCSNFPFQQQPTQPTQPNQQVTINGSNTVLIFTTSGSYTA